MRDSAQDYFVRFGPENYPEGSRIICPVFDVIHAGSSDEAMAEALRRYPDQAAILLTDTAKPLSFGHGPKHSIGPGPARPEDYNHPNAE
jgi:hypothetical protein